MERGPMDDSTLQALAGIAALDLSPDRRAVVAPALEGMLAQFDTMLALDVGETPPAHSFDARWKDAP